MQKALFVPVLQLVLVRTQYTGLIVMRMLKLKVIFILQAESNFKKNF